MSLSLNKVVEFTVIVVVAFASFVANAGISIDGSPSSTGNYGIIIHADVWIDFDEDPGLTAELTENGTKIADLNSGLYYSEQSYTYNVNGRSVGEYDYVLELYGPRSDAPVWISRSYSTSAVVTQSFSHPGDLNKEVNLSGYDLYYGDFNDDGIDGDIYFHARNIFVLIASDISIPLLLEGPEDFVVYRNSSPESYSGPFLVTSEFTNIELETLDKLVLGYDYLQGDIDGDGSQDFFVRGIEAGTKAFVMIQESTGLPDVREVVAFASNSFDPSDRSNTLVLQDYNLDGKADLVLLSGPGGIVWDVILAGNGTLNENYSTVASMDDMFSFNTLPANTDGTLGGSFRVSESGAATYSVPILTPQGTAGVTPQVSLNYSSQGGVGLLGKGWNLAANSAITRCRKTLGQDKSVEPITWTSSDRFCLNGQRLLLESGTYGANGSTYGTEIDSYSRITAHGQSNGEPEYFTEIKKDGSITYYGLTTGLGLSTNSKQQYSGKTYSWAEAVSTDNIGNPVKYFYKQDNGKNFRLDEIKYAYGSSSSAKTRIKFTYERRPDPFQGWVAGRYSEFNLRLKRIDVFNNVNSERNIRSYHAYYSLEVEGNISTRKSLLGALQECVGSSCKKPTKFTWSLKEGYLESSWDHRIQVGSSSDPLNQFQVADFNGDGIQDLAWINFDISGSMDSSLEYAVSNNGNLQKANFSNGVNKLSFAEDGVNEHIEIKPLDYNADGRSDLAVYRSRGTYTNQWVVYLSLPVNSNGSIEWRLSANAIPLNIGGGYGATQFIDINSDGLVDVLKGSSAYYMVPSGQDVSSNTFFKFEDDGLPSPWTEVGDSTTVEFWRAGYTGSQYFVENTQLTSKPMDKYGDFNGDGLVDMLGLQMRRSVLKQHTNNGGWTYVGGYPYPVEEHHLFVLVKLPTGPYKAIHEFPMSGNNRYKIADINQDGLSDILVKSNASVSVYFSNGLGFEEPVQVASVTASSEVDLVDFNGDGYVDLIEYPEPVSGASTATSRVRVWDANSFSFVSLATGGLQYIDNQAKLFLDFNGDGSVDFLRYKNGYIEVFEYVNQRDTAESITLIDTGSGANTLIEYEKLNNSEHYSALDVGIVPGDQDEVCRVAGRGEIICSHVLADADDFYTALNQGIESSLSRLSSIAPVLEMNGPFQVVTRVSNQVPSSALSNNVNSLSGNSGVANVNPGTRAAVEYYYAEAKMQAGGRGFLGFHTLSTVDVQTGIRTSTIYRQDFPFIGSPLSTFVYAPNNEGLLSESHNVYELLGWPTNANSIALSNGTAALGPIKPFVRESVEVSYLSQSSVESSGTLTLLGGASVNIGGCVDDGQGCHPYLNRTTEQLISHKVITLNQIDSHGNALATIVETTGDGLTQRIEMSNEYGPGSVVIHGKSFSYAELGRLTKATVTKTRNGNTEPSQYSEFEYYDSASGFAGMLEKEIVAPDGVNNEKLETTYYYNNFGLLTQKNVSGWDGTATVTRSAETFYDTSGRFVNYSKDALNHKLDEVLARNEYGAPTLINGLNGVQVTKKYDAWGRETFTSSNSGGSVSTFYASCPNSSLECPDEAKTAVFQRTSAAGNAITAVTFYDLMGREIRAGSLSFNGAIVYVDTEYDVIGRVVRTSLPYFESDLGTSLDWSRNYYDILGRPLLSYAPDGSIGKFEYDGYKHISINALDQKKTETKNGLGELVEVEDELGGRITYSYNTDGSLSTTTAHKDNETVYAYGTIPGLCKQPTSNLQVVLCYDRLGRKTEMWDPDKGHWTYEYNAFGDLIKQTNANGHYVQTQYDILGRVIKRWDYKVGGALEGFTTWHYDDKDDQGQSVINAVLQTTAVAYSEGREHAFEDVTNEADHVVRSLFDNYGRLDMTDTKMPDGEMYISEVEYDSEGRVKKEFNVLNGLLKNTNGTAIQSGIQNHYDARGFLEYVTNLEDGKHIFEPTAYDEKGNLKTASLGAKVMITNEYDQHTGLLTSRTAVSGAITQNFTYKWDAIGNLTSRTDQNSTLGGSTSLIEEFCYDELNRVIKSYESINSTGSLSNPVCPTNETAFDVTYDQLGNIKRKAGVGNYAYGEVDSTNHRAGPHALTSLSGSATKYRYDENGNLLSDGSRSFVYSTFDKPLEITKGSHTTKFKYGPSRSRFYREDNFANGTTDRTWYLGNIEKIEKANGTIEWRRTLDGGVLHSYTTNSSYVISSLKKRYILKEHLGSSSLILEEQGANVVVAQSMSFDVWGQRRNAQNMQDLTATQLTNFNHSITTRGYTGHEMLDEVGVIHMNGRIYDARLGRFLQADPHIQAPTDTQSYNRYSYVRNNPLNATDPSGYFWQVAVGMAAGFMAQKWGEALHAPWISAVGTMICGAVGGGAGAIGCAGGAGFGVTYGATGDFSQALQSGLIAAGSAWAFSKIGQSASNASEAHNTWANYLENTYGLEGVRSSYVEFGSYLLTPGEVAKLIASHAIVGGIVSELQGGKFAHGFLSAGLTKGVMGSAGFDYSNRSFGAIAGRTAVATILGGTTSKISGGKFVNGAMTAAIAHLFNAESSSKNKRSCGQMCRKMQYPDSGFDGHRQLMLVGGLLAFGGTALSCGATFGATCVLGYLASTRMTIEGATGTDIIGYPIQETASHLGASPGDAELIANTSTLMLDIGSLTVGSVGIFRTGVFMFDDPLKFSGLAPVASRSGAVIIPGSVMLSDEVFLIGVSGVDIIHDSMVISGDTK